MSSSRDLGTEKMPWGVVHWGRESGETPPALTRAGLVQPET